MNISKPHTKTTYIFFGLSALLYTVLYFFLPIPTSEQLIFKTEEQATFCTLEHREECITGLAFAIEPCEPSYKEACENFALAILNDPHLYLANSFPYDGNTLIVTPDASIKYTQKNPKYATIEVNLFPKTQFLKERFEYPSVYFSAHGEAVPISYEFIMGNIKSISQNVEAILSKKTIRN